MLNAVVVSIVTYLITVSFCQAQSQGISDTELLSSVPNVPVPWLDPFATVDVKDQQNLDWGPLPKPADSGPGTSNSNTDVKHAVEDLVGNMDGVNQNTHDANQAHFIDFWLAGGELPPSLTSHLSDTVGSFLEPQGIPDVVGTGLGSPNGNFPANSGELEQIQATSTLSPSKVQSKTTTSTIAQTSLLTTALPASSPLPVSTTMPPVETTVRQVPVQTTISSASKAELDRLEKQRLLELARKRIAAINLFRERQKAKQEEKEKLAQKTAHEQRLALIKATLLERQRKLQQKIQKERAQRIEKEKKEAKRQKALRQLAALREKAKTDRAAANLLARFEARLRALRKQHRQNQRNQGQGKSRQNFGNPKNPNRQSQEEIKKRQEAFLKQLMQ